MGFQSLVSAGGLVRRLAEGRLKGHNGHLPRRRERHGVARQLHLIATDFQLTSSHQVLQERRKDFLGHAGKFTAEFFREHGRFERVGAVEFLEQLHDLRPGARVLVAVEQPRRVLVNGQANPLRTQAFHHRAQCRLVKGAAS